MDRQIQIDRYQQTQIQIDIKTQRPIDKWKQSDIDIETDRRMNRLTDILRGQVRYRETQRQIEKATDIPTESQTQRQIDRQRQKQ